MGLPTGFQPNRHDRISSPAPLDSSAMVPISLEWQIHALPASVVPGGAVRDLHPVESLLRPLVSNVVVHACVSLIDR